MTMHQKYMDFAYDLAKEKASCLKRKVGAIVVRDNIILTTGVNVPPKGSPACVTCIREDLNIKSGTHHELCYAVHAEQNCIIKAAKYDFNIQGSILYTTLEPCVICTKMIINAGILKVYFNQPYNDPFAREIVKNSSVIFSRLST